MKAFIAIVSVLAKTLVVATLSASGLSGAWIIESKTPDGVIQGELELREEGRNLSVTFRIDNHVLRGSTEIDGPQFDVVLSHADGSGVGHSERIRLIGRLDEDSLTGSFDNGVDRGVWSGRRK